ncbi:MAG: hypothetical protein K1X83_08020 [Oligoflexia bacterium]|nr:hypothetical protein [Oligoflexia bacterium]
MRRLDVYLKSGLLIIVGALLFTGSAQAISIFPGEGGGASPRIGSVVNIDCGFVRDGIELATALNRMPLKVCTKIAPGNVNNGQKKMGLSCSASGDPSSRSLTLQASSPNKRINVLLSLNLPDANGLIDGDINVRVEDTLSGGDLAFYNSRVTLVKGKSFDMYSEHGNDMDLQSMLSCLMTIE